MLLALTNHTGNAASLETNDESLGVKKLRNKGRNLFEKPHNFFQILPNSTNNALIDSQQTTLSSHAHFKLKVWELIEFGCPMCGN